MIDILIGIGLFIFSSLFVLWVCMKDELKDPAFRKGLFSGQDEDKDA